MHVERANGLKEVLENLSDTDVLEQTAKALADPDVKKITILPNRHDRRRQAATDRKKRNGVKK